MLVFSNGVTSESVNAWMEVSGFVGYPCSFLAIFLADDSFSGQVP